MVRSIWKYLIFIFTIFILLTGCQKEGIQSQPSVSSNSEKPSSNRTIEQNTHEQTERKIIPLEVNEEHFGFIIGWLNNETVVLYESINEDYVISSYHIYSGNREKIYTSDLPIIQAVLSPSNTRLLIHTSPTIYEADVKIIDIQEKELIFQDIIESSEISFVWNGYDESQLFVVAFYEDWTFHTYTLNLQEQTKTETKIPYPFAIWHNTNTLLTLDWGNDSPRISAPILSFTNGESKSVLNKKEFYFLHGWKGIFLALSENENDKNIADFNFYDDHLQLVQTIQFPHLSEYSNWEIPRFNLVKNETFYIVAPKTSGEADIYDGGFDLIKVDLLSGEQEVVIENIANEPILSSPDGSMILFGFQYENVIEVNKNQMVPFLKFN